MNKEITDKTEQWLIAIKKNKCAKIIRSGLISLSFEDLVMVGEFDEWCIYSAEIRVAGKYYVKLDNSLQKEKQIIEKCLMKVAEQDNIKIRYTSWSVNLPGINPRSDKQENLIVDNLKKSIKKLSPNVKVQIESGIDEYIREKYISATRILYPTIEEIANLMLSKHGENPNDRSLFRGLFDKLRRVRLHFNVNTIFIG